MFLASGDLDLATRWVLRSLSPPLETGRTFDCFRKESMVSMVLCNSQDRIVKVTGIATLLSGKANCWSQPPFREKVQNSSCGENMWSVSICHSVMFSVDGRYEPPGVRLKMPLEYFSPQLLSHSQISIPTANTILAGPFLTARPREPIEQCNVYFRRLKFPVIYCAATVTSTVKYLPIIYAITETLSLHCVLKASFWLASLLPSTLARPKFSWCCSSVAKSRATLRLHGLPPPASSVHGSSRQEHWSGLPFPPPGDLPDPGVEPPSPALVSRFSTIEPLGKPIQVLSPLQTLLWLFQSTRSSLFSKFLSMTSLTGCSCGVYTLSFHS